jgi:hypothetical protein
MKPPKRSLMVKDDDRFAGFASLHQAITEGFDRMERRFSDVRLGRLDTCIAQLEERTA